MRNYSAMGDAKLEQVIEQLSAGTGDARGREDDWRAALDTALKVAADRGLSSTALVREEVPTDAGLDPTLGLKPMLAKPIVDIPEDGDWLMEAKIDGWRGLAFVDHNKVRMLAGRNATDHTGEAPHIEEALEGLPPGTVIDGELVVNKIGAQSSDVRHSLAHKLDDLVYVVFDVLRWAHEDLTRKTLVNRKAVLAANRDSLVKDPIGNGAGPVTLAPFMPATQDDHDRIVAAGFEGTVTKRADSFYYPGKKSGEWGKLKASATEDALVIGIEDGKGDSNRGRPGAFTVKLASGIETSAKIKNEEMVRYIEELQRTRQLEQVVGVAIVELKHNGEMNSGKLRHPVVRQIRHDHDAATLFAKED